MSALMAGVGREPADSEVELVACANEAIRAAVADELKMVNVSTFDVPPPPPAVGVDTVTWAVPTVATYDAGIAALTPVVPTKVVVGLFV